MLNNNKKLSSELGQITIGPVEITGPIKARISTKFLPSFTLDLTVKPKIGLLSIMQPKITLLLAGKAYEIGWGQSGIKSVDPKIFETDTFLDTMQKIGIIPIVLFVSGLAYLGYKVLLKK